MISVGELPNNTQKTVDTGIVNAYYYWIDTANSMIYGVGSTYLFPYVDPGNLANAVTGRIIGGGKQLVVTTKTSWSGYSAYIVVKYTKKL